MPAQRTYPDVNVSGRYLTLTRCLSPRADNPQYWESLPGATAITDVEIEARTGYTSSGGHVRVFMTPRPMQHLVLFAKKRDNTVSGIFEVTWTQAHWICNGYQDTHHLHWMSVPRSHIRFHEWETQRIHMDSRLQREAMRVPVAYGEEDIGRTIEQTQELLRQAGLGSPRPVRGTIPSQENTVGEPHRVTITREQMGNLISQWGRVLPVEVETANNHRTFYLAHQTSREEAIPPQEVEEALRAQQPSTSNFRGFLTPYSGHGQSTSQDQRPQTLGRVRPGTANVTIEEPLAEWVTNSDGTWSIRRSNTQSSRQE